MSWVQKGSDIDGEAEGNQSGYSVSISSDGTVVAIGARYNDGTIVNASDNRGHVRVYAWNGSTSTWVQRGLDIDGEAAGDQSGFSVSLSSDGTVVAIGAPLNVGNASTSGHVRVYEWNGSTSTWVKRGADINGEAAGDESGTSVSLSSDGTVVAIGAYLNDGTTGNTIDNRGHVRVYVWNGSTWVKRGADIDGEAAGDESGTSVSLSSDGTVVAIGAPFNSGTTSYAGHVRVYAWNGSTWVQRGSDIDGEAGSDRSGYSVSLSSDGTVVAIGAYLNDGTGTSAGHVRVYAWNGTSWGQRGAEIDGEAAGDNSGRSVSLSSDGTVVAIGANNNDGTTGVSTDNRGHVRVYAWNGSTSTWVKRGVDIDGEAGGDQSGFSVSLSSDGTVVAIGAYQNDGTTGVSTDNRGHVRVYSMVPLPPTDLSATPGNQTVQIAFTASDNGGSAITNYMYSTDGGSTFTAFSPSQTTSPVTISGLTNGTQYSIQLKAVNANGASTASGTVTATPAAPSGGGGIPCIPTGQRILTPSGYKLIETLKQGDLIQTSDGRSVPVRLYSTTLEKTTEETAPVRIGTTLRLSPLHAFKVNKHGWMIPKLAVLKNLYDVKQEAPGQPITYYHVETANYLRDNLVVEGTIVEGYGRTFAKAHNLSLNDIYKRSKNGPWLERISSVPRPSKTQ